MYAVQHIYGVPLVLGFKPFSVITEDEREIASEGGMRHVAPEGELL